jgi:hypothetical protein
MSASLRPADLSRAGTALAIAREQPMDDLIRTFSARGDLAHLALFLWASAASALLVFVTRELSAAMRRFDDFVRELARFNDRFRGKQ